MGVGGPDIPGIVLFLTCLSDTDALLPQVSFATLLLSIFVCYIALTTVHVCATIVYSTCSISTACRSASQGCSALGILERRWMQRACEVVFIRTWANSMCFR